MRSIFLLLGLFTAAACNFTPMTVTPDIQTASEKSDIGVGKAVEVQITDTIRAEKKPIGYWGKPGNTDAPITLSTGPGAVIVQAVAEGLAAKGFGKDVKGKPRRLDIELNKLTYANSYEDFWRIHLIVEAELHAKTGAYEKTYPARVEKKYFQRPSAEDNSRQVNAALSLAVTQLLNDPALLAELAKK